MILSLCYSELPWLLPTYLRTYLALLIISESLLGLETISPTGPIGARELVVRLVGSFQRRSLQTTGDIISWDTVPTIHAWKSQVERRKEPVIDARGDTLPDDCP